MYSRFRSPRPACFIPFAAVVCALTLLVAPPARADSVSLDADYTGMVGLHYIVAPAVAAYGAGGTNFSAPLGLTTVEAGTEGFFDVFGDQISFTQTDHGSVMWTATNGDRLAASFSGQGTMRAFDGTFQITGGSGMFKDAMGGGTFSFVSPTWIFSGSPSLAPATLSVRGNVATAVPEPGSLALLAAGLAPLATCVASRRRGRGGRARNGRAA